MALKNWMADHQDKTLGEIHMPGSHDAGTIDGLIDKTLLGTDSNSVTQNLSISEQLNIGTRFFDLRLTEHSGNIVAHHTALGQGARGTRSVNQMIKAAADFCNANKTEVVIFRISHTSAKTKADELVQNSAVDTLHTGTGNLCKKKLKEIVLEGGLVCIFDNEKFGTLIDQKQGIHSFTKYKKNPANDRGISVCGCYSGTHKLHNVVRNGLRGQYAHTENHNAEAKGHLWQLYWQKTYLNPFSTTGIQRGTKKKATLKWTETEFGSEGGRVHGGTHAATKHMIKLMKGHAGFYGEDYNVAKKKKHFWHRQKVIMRSTLQTRSRLLPNIFSYDFVNSVINKEIIALNENAVQDVLDE